MHFESSPVMVTGDGWSASMVTRYDVIRRRGSIHFLGERTCVQLFSTIKVNHVAKIMQSTYLSVIFHLKHKKSPYRAVLT